LKEIILEILNGVLKEELERLKELEKNYEEKIAKLPKGSLIKKNIKGNIYYYLNYRKGKKGIFEYLGKLRKEEIDKMKEKIAERRKLVKLKRQVKKDIKNLEKIINGSKK
jgi:hypothetical protein